MRFTSADREIASLAWPALGALAAEPLYVLTDNAIVGRIGTPELGGLAVATAALLIAHSIFIFLAYGTTGAVARLVGAGDLPKAAHQAVQGLWLALFIGIAVFIIGQLSAPWIIRLVGGSEDVRGHAMTYFRISLFGFPALLIMLAGVGYLRGLKDTKRPFVVALSTAAFNLVLELVLIEGFGYGVGASALSTVLAQFIGAGLYLWWIGRSVRNFGVTLGPDFDAIRRLARAGADLLIRTTSLRGSFLVATAVAARISETDLASFQISFELWSFVALVADSLAIAAQSLIGQFLGAGDAAGARLIATRLMGWGVAVGVVLLIVMGSLSQVLPRLFSNDTEVIALTSILVVHMALQQPINVLVFTLDGILIGAGDLSYLARAMMVAAACFIPTALMVLWLGGGAAWLWGAIWVLMIVRLVTMWFRYRTDAWLKTGAVLR